LTALLSVGVLTPHAAAGPEEELPLMAPGLVETKVERASSATAGGSAPDLRALTRPPLLDDAAEAVAGKAVDVIAYASTSSAYTIGFDSEITMESRLSRRIALPVVATYASAVLELRHLGVERPALVHPPWFGGLNELGAEYVRSQGFGVAMSASADLAQDPDRIEPAAVLEWASTHVPEDADGVFIGGNGFRAAGAIEELEAALARPVVESNQVLLWTRSHRPGSGLSSWIRAAPPQLGQLALLRQLDRVAVRVRHPCEAEIGEEVVRRAE
jgi:maleate isomerase